MAWTLLIRNGTVVDGSGAPGYAADVAVEGDRIVAIERRLVGEARRTIDAAGFTVSPGFIDIHSHSDLFYLGCPAAESKLRQGVTTEVVGMCSFSPAPVGGGVGGVWRGSVAAEAGEALHQHRPLRRPRGAAPGRPRPGEPPPLGRRAAGDGAPARRGPGGGGGRGFPGGRPFPPTPPAPPPPPWSSSRSPNPWLAAAASTSPTSGERRRRWRRPLTRRSRSAKARGSRSRSPTSRRRDARTGTRWTPRSGRSATPVPAARAAPPPGVR